MGGDRGADARGAACQRLKALRAERLANKVESKNRRPILGLPQILPGISTETENGGRAAGGGVRAAEGGARAARGGARAAGAETEQVQLGAGLCRSGFMPPAALNTGGGGFPHRGAFPGEL